MNAEPDLDPNIVAAMEGLSVIYTHAIAALVGAAVAAIAAWNVQAWRYDAQIATLKTRHVETLQTISGKTAKAYDAVVKYEVQVQQDLAAKDVQHREELTHAKTETDRLRACVRAGTCGVRIVTTAVPSARACAGPEDAAAAGVGNGAVELDAAAAERVLDLRDSVHADAAKLAYLRDYARTCYRAGIDAGQLND
jgi:prophage endopeptidase